MINKTTPFDNIVFALSFFFIILILIFRKRKKTYLIIFVHEYFLINQLFFFFFFFFFVVVVCYMHISGLGVTIANPIWSPAPLVTLNFSMNQFT